MTQPNEDLFKRVPQEVSVYEVSLRDGLQNENATVPLSGKLRLVDALVASGLRRIEITSFVSPRWIPQLADADELAEVVSESRAPAAPDVCFSALCPNAPHLVGTFSRFGRRRVAPSPSRPGWTA